MWKRWTSARSVVGRLEGRRGRHVTGWAYRTDDPPRPVTLGVLAGDEAFEITTGLHRPDVAEAGHPAGLCGFAIPVARLGAAGTLRVVVAETGLELIGSPLDLEQPGIGWPKLHAGPHLVLHLAPRGVAAGLAGIAYDPSRLHRRSRLALTGRAGVLAETRAVRYAEACRIPGDDGLHGFTFMPVDPAAGPFHLRDHETGTAVAVPA